MIENFCREGWSWDLSSRKMDNGSFWLSHSLLATYPATLVVVQTLGKNLLLWSQTDVGSSPSSATC